MDLTAPFMLPERIARSLIEELAGLRRSLEQVGAAVESVERVETIANQALPVAERGIVVMERLIATIDRATEEVEPMIASMDSAQAKVDPLIASINSAQKQVDPLIATVEAALPALEQAVSMSKPLEGSVERLGRALDRLPGGRPSRRDDEDGAGGELE